MSLRLVRALLTGTAIFLPTAIPAAALAQSSGAASSATTDDNKLTEIVVTASKRSENLQKAPAAISVVGGDAIEKVGVVDPTQLPKLVPSLVIGKQGANAVVFLRGVGQTNSTPSAQPGISTNIDGVYLPRMVAGGSLFDLERIEVLPGPQGTLYGRNSAGGAINLVTRKPGSDYGGEGYVEAGNFSLTHGFGAVDVPVNSMLSVRAALDVNKHDGYLSNGGDDADALAGRVTASFKPNEDLSATVQYSHLREDGIGLQEIAKGTDTPPFGSKNDPYFDSFPTNNLFQRTRGNILTADISLRLTDDITLTYLPGYVQGKSVQGLQFNATAYGLFNSRTRQYSQELRLANDGKGPMKWLAGLFWFHSQEGLDVNIGLPAVAFVHFINNLDSYAAFGEGTYSLSNRFRLTLGGRYSSDRYDGDGFQKVPAFGIQDLFGAKKTQGRFDWKIGAEFDAAPQSMLYATAQSGYLQGGFTQANASSSLPKTFQPVKLVALTAGSKNRFLDDRLQVNDEVFYYSYKGYQLQSVQQDPATQEAIFVIINIPEATIYGDQLDFAYSADANTDVNLTVAYLHAEITKGLKSVPSFDNFTLPNAPKWSINGSIERRFPLSNGGHITARVASSFSSSYWTVFTHDDFSHQGSFTKTDLNLTYYSPDGHWNIGGFARNIENSVVYYGSNASNGPGTPLPTFIDAPRTYGVRAGFKF